MRKFLRTLPEFTIERIARDFGYCQGGRIEYIINKCKEYNLNIADLKSGYSLT